MNMKKISIFNFTALILLMSSFNVKAAIADYDVIVNPSVSQTEITKDQVKQILLANVVEFDKKKVTLVVLSPDAAEADALDKEAIGMTAVQAKKYWLTKVFNGVFASAPPAVDSPDEVAEKVGNTPGAFAVVPKGTKPGKAKLLKLN